MIRTIFNSKPDVEVNFEFNDVRKTPVRDGYRPHHLVNESYLTTGVHRYYDKDFVCPGESAKGTITFILPEAHPNCFWVGKRITIQEGERIVGYATIVKIFNPILANQGTTNQIHDQSGDGSMIDKK